MPYMDWNKNIPWMLHSIICELITFLKCSRQYTLPTAGLTPQTIIRTISLRQISLQLHFPYTFCFWFSMVHQVDYLSAFKCTNFVFNHIVWATFLSFPRFSDKWPSWRWQQAAIWQLRTSHTKRRKHFMNRTKPGLTANNMHSCCCCPKAVHRSNIK